MESAVAEPARDWYGVVTLIEGVMREPDLLDEVVAEVRRSIRDISGLDPADVARHTRGLLAAATRALAERRGPTEAELSFVEDLARARAQQGIAIHAVLSAIHVAERRIWARARVVAGAGGIPAELVLEARGLYDDWAQLVRERLMLAHAATLRTGVSGRSDHLVRRLLGGGSAARLAAVEAGLVDPATGGSLVVAIAPGLTAPVAQAVRVRLAGLGLGPVALEGDAVVAVWRRLPRSLTLDVAVGVSAPSEPEALAAARAQAQATGLAAHRRGLTGLVPVGRAATLSALQERDDLGALLVDTHAESLGRLARADASLATVRTWLECGRDADLAAARLFVHPNTVRNRVGAVVAAVGLDPDDPFEAVDLWWLCVAWIER